MNNVLNLFKALSDKNRLRVVYTLTQYEELSACQIIELLQVTGATVSRHLSILINSGLVENRKEGRWVYFKLRNMNEDDDFQQIIDWIKKNISKTIDAESDIQKVKKIIAWDLEELCRKQRGEKCCPSKDKKILK